MQVVTYYLLKTALSVLFLFIIAFAARELYRLWFVQRITLAPFAYQKDGTENEGQGKAFSQRVYQELRGLQNLLNGDRGAPAAESGPIPKTTQRAPGQVTTLEPPSMTPAIGTSLTIPEVQKLPLAGIELTVQGVDFASLARSLYQWTDPPDEFVGSVVEGNQSFNTLVEWRRVGRNRANDMRFAADGHASLDDASFATACNVLYLLILDRDEEFKKRLSRAEFEIFARSLRQYSAYRTAVTEMRPKEATDKARTDLDEADRLAAGLIERSAGDRFSPIYMLGAITAVAKSDFPRARGHLVAYRKANPDDKKAEELENLLPPPPVQVAAAERVEGAGVPREKYRPVQPGVSAASGESSAGTICCVVRDKSASNKLYFLSTEHVFAGQPGAAVVQPSPLDGGSAPADVVAHLVKALTPKINVENRVAGAIAAIANRTLVNPNCFAVGAFTGVADVSPDDEVTLVGRTSGVAKGRVVAVDSVTSIWTGEGSVTFSGLITCQGTAGGSFSEGGDSGAPVVNARNELVGMLYAGSENVSIVIPIKPILDAFGVELVTE